MEEIFNSIRKYNFWDEKKHDLGYFRADYANKILSYLDNSLVKVLIGKVLQKTT